MDSQNGYPEHLAHSPLVEAVFEVRFQSNNKAAGDLLPGLLYSRLSDQYQQVEQAMAARVPPEVRAANPTLHYQAHYRMVGEGKTLLVGDRMLGISQNRPYSGWRDFREEIIRVLGAARETSLLTHIERYSAKYVNLLEAPEGRQLALLDADVRLNGYSTDDRALRLRTEMDLDGFKVLITIETGVRLHEGTRPAGVGLRLDVDAVRYLKDATFWEGLERKVDEAHAVAKRVFFSLLKAETVKAMGPR